MKLVMINRRNANSICVRVLTYTTRGGAEMCYTAFRKNIANVNMYLVFFKVL